VGKRAGLHETWTETKDDGKEITHHWPTSHDLRDTFGTRLALKDFNAHEIKSVMGHSSIEQAVDYIELSGVATTKAMEEKW
jgi:integrase